MLPAPSKLCKSEDGSRASNIVNRDFPANLQAQSASAPTDF
jgi:hypothetical protein